MSLPRDDARTRPEPAFDAAQRAAFERAVGEYDRGAFFECHDTLEELWSELRGPARDFVQGLIQVAVSFYHLDNGNSAGAASLLGRALARFAPYPARYYGLDLDALRAELHAWRERVRGGAVRDFAAAQAPRWRFEAPQRADDARRYTPRA